MQPERAMSPFLLLITLIGITTADFPAAASNFECADAEVRQAAEQARLRSAQFWSGSALPGDWYAPCPIRVIPANHSGGGKTQFRIAGGEVFSWTMEVSGTRQSILQDVIPHEVDHMVRASLTRRSVERWLDEGCAALMESPVSHQLQRDIAFRQGPRCITLEWLEADDYPTNPEEIAAVYAVGFSLVEYLLQRGSPGKLLEFQREDAAIKVRLARHYGLTVETLRAGWWNWLQSVKGRTCSQAGCKLHSSRESPNLNSYSKVSLTIWTAAWCGPCQKLKADLVNDQDFSQKLNSSYELTFRDFDSARHEAAAQGIENLPTFVLPDRKFSGYFTPQDLLERLGVPEQTQPVDRPQEMNIPQAEPVVEAPEAEVPSAGGNGWELLRWVPLTLSALQWTGVISGTFLTGGIGGAALAVSMFVLKQGLSFRRRISKTEESLEERSAVAVKAPFPRQLDEAGELLRLRQTEGRVATLDTLRGMFLDDELDKLEQSDPASAQLVRNLRKAIAARVEEVAPLTTKV